MPFSFSNMSPLIILLMLACLTSAELIKYLQKKWRHSGK
jgi:hypothetical protein